MQTLLIASVIKLSADKVRYRASPAVAGNKKLNPALNILGRKIIIDIIQNNFLAEIKSEMVFALSDAEISSPLHAVISASYRGNNNGILPVRNSDGFLSHLNGGSIIALRFIAVGFGFITAVLEHGSDMLVPIACIK